MSTLESALTPDTHLTQLSSLIIGVIVISGVTAASLIFLSVLCYKKQRNKKREMDTEQQQQTKDIPVTTSSLDTDNVFFTLLEYPPIATTSNRLLDVPDRSTSSFDQEKKRWHDPISVSLVRQSIEERSGYYKSPTRTPIPYYQLSTSLQSSHLKTMTPEEDEVEQAMQRWSDSSYHVW